MGVFSRLGNDLYTGRRSIDFVGRRWLWYAISAGIIVVAVLGLQVRGLDMGIEFTGGSEYRVELDKGQVNQDNADALREAVAATGIPNAAAPVVTTSGESAILIQVQNLSSDESNQVTEAISDAVGVDAQDVSHSDIGPSWGQEVAKRSLIGLIVFLVLVVLFIWAYFREWKMSVAALVALAHDVVITIGVYALSGFEVTPATVTGVLTILGFSLYDTVVVFDKVRENTADLKSTRMTYAEAANLAVNQTLVRSINTSIVALIPVGAILYVGAVQLGSGSLKDLALALFVGMAAGAYSSIFIATPLLVQLKEREKDVQLSDKRVQTKRRHQADRYANVPSFSEDMPVADEPGADPQAPAAAQAAPRQPAPARPMARPTEAGRGRVAPPAHGPVSKSAASGRNQPTRQTRSKRGKK